MNQKAMSAGRQGFANTIVIIIGVIILVGVAGYFIIGSQAFFKKPAKVVNSFEECAAAGYPIMESYPEQCKTPDGRTFTRKITPQAVAFGSFFTFAAQEQVKFSDGLTVTLVEINDSRCKSGVVCIWAGELAPMFRITEGTADIKEIRLGTVRARNVTENGYTFVLQDATLTTATIAVTKKEAPLPIPTPIPAPNAAKIIKAVGETEGSFLIQKINSDSVEGLWYAAYPIARPEGTPRTLHIGDDIGYACEGVSEKLISIDYSGQTVTFTKVIGQPSYGGCPICLAGNTMIDTPQGLVPVKDLQIGMPIWTTDKPGRRVSGIIQKTSRVLVPPTHQMVHLVLDDGRELLVSPGHPTVDGRTVGNFIVNDFYDGARVVAFDRVVYDDIATYDILPSGETGFYWASGILLDSTLH